MIRGNFKFGEDFDGMLEKLQGQFSRWLISCFEDNEGFDQLMPFGIGNTDDRRFGNGRMLDHGAFHLEGADAEIRGFDDIVAAADKPPVAIFIKGGAVAGIVERC